MLIRNNLALKAGGICISIIEQLAHILIVEHSVLLFELVDFDVGLSTYVAAVALVVDIRLPFSEVMVGCAQIEVLLGCRFVVVIFILGCFDQA
jgi:hypothetical protein